MVTTEKLSTSELCDILNITRTWIYTHMRSLGKAATPEDVSENPGYRNKVLYDVKDVLEFIYIHGDFTRQTEFEDMKKHAITEQRFADTMNKIKQEPARRRAALYKDFLEKSYVYDFIPYGENGTGRRLYPWVVVEYVITDLKELKTIKQLGSDLGYNNTEAVYRHIFRNGMIRVNVFGRSWYVQPLIPKCGVLVPAKEKNI